MSNMDIRLCRHWGNLTLPALVFSAVLLPAMAQELAVGLQPVVSGLSAPIGIENAGDSSGRIFIIQRSGQIIIVRNGTMSPTPFLDISARVMASGERGLLGLAFHPDYASNGVFFVHYSEDSAGDTVIERCTVTSGDPDIGDCSGEDVIFTLDQPAANHNGGKIAFGPDGYLYVALGDGGGGGDPNENAQDVTDLHGKILRLDVDGDDFSGDPLRDYAVPPDNPFVGQTGSDEIWAFGLRNPWRISFDRMTGDLWIGDVGQADWEEIDFEPEGDPGGRNYGWDVLEGAHCFEDVPVGSCNDFQNGGSTLPVVEIDSSDATDNRSITGGFRYRGSAQPRLFGYYVYGDFGSGRIWGLLLDCNGGWVNRELADTNSAIASFGEDEDGELYLVDLGSGTLYHIVVTAGAGGPALDPTPGTLGYTSSPQTLATEIFNNGTGSDDAVIEAFALSDMDHFQLDTGGGASPCGAPPVCLASGESCTVEVTFAPQREGGFDEFLTFLANSAPDPASLQAEVACSGPDHLLLENQVVSDDQWFAGCQTVTAGTGFQVTGSGRAELRGGVSVALQPGASVAPGGRLSLVVDPLLAQP